MPGTVTLHSNHMKQHNFDVHRRELNLVEQPPFVVSMVPNNKSGCLCYNKMFHLTYGVSAWSKLLLHIDHHKIVMVGILTNVKFSRFIIIIFVIQWCMDSSSSGQHYKCNISTYRMLDSCMLDKPKEQPSTLSLFLASRDDVKVQFRDYQQHFIQSMLSVLTQCVTTVTPLSYTCVHCIRSCCH